MMGQRVHGSAAYNLFLVVYVPFGLAWGGQSSAILRIVWSGLYIFRIPYLWSPGTYTVFSLLVGWCSIYGQTKIHLALRTKSVLLSVSPDSLEELPSHCERSGFMLGAFIAGPWFLSCTGLCLLVWSHPTLRQEDSSQNQQQWFCQISGKIGPSCLWS